MSEPVFTDFPLRRAMRPTLRTWIKHSLLLLITFFTTTIASNVYPFGQVIFLADYNPETWSEFFLSLPSLPFLYVQFVWDLVGLVFSNSFYLGYGLKFSLSFLFILICHEAGHYVACRIYGVDATLPYFIPTPPLIGVGTLGAFIRILSPLPSRKATFDIGVAGPIAGFIALIPIAIVGFITMEPAPLVENIAEGGSPITFSDALFTKVLAFFFGIDLTLPIYQNPFYFAAWVGLLVTSLNLIPSGQLDGGHAVYSVFGERIHYWTGRVAFAVMVILSIFGIYFYGTPSALLFTILLGFMMRVKHPKPLDDSPLDFKRQIVAVITLIIFILCFVPFPVQVR